MSQLSVSPLSGRWSLLIFPNEPIRQLLIESLHWTQHCTSDFNVSDPCLGLSVAIILPRPQIAPEALIIQVWCHLGSLSDGNTRMTQTPFCSISIKLWFQFQLPYCALWIWCHLCRHRHHFAEHSMMDDQLSCLMIDIRSSRAISVRVCLRWIMN